MSPLTVGVGLLVLTSVNLVLLWAIHKLAAKKHTGLLRTIRQLQSQKNDLLVKLERKKR